MLNTKQEIEIWLNKYEIKNYTINDDMTVDVDGDVWLYGRKFKEIPVKFNIVKGDLCCSKNKLTSTEFLPKEVHGYFSCYNNKFTNLDNFPKIVTRLIDIRINPNLENIIGLWNCDFTGKTIWCDKKWKEEFQCYLLSINRLKEVEF